MAREAEAIAQLAKEIGGDKVNKMLQYAITKGANVLPGYIYDHIRLPAASPNNPTIFFQVQKGAAPGAFTTGTKDWVDTNLSTASRLNSDESFIGVGLMKSYPPRWLSYGAAVANRQDDFLNLMKDVEQLEGAMGAYIQVQYQGSYDFLDAPLYQIPGGVRPASFAQTVGNPENYMRFNRVAAFEIGKETNIAVNQGYTAPAAFGSTSYVIEGMYIVGLRIKGLSNLGQEFRDMIANYNAQIGKGAA